MVKVKLKFAVADRRGTVHAWHLPAFVASQPFPACGGRKEEVLQMRRSVKIVSPKYGPSGSCRTRVELYDDAE